MEPESPEIESIQLSDVLDFSLLREEVNNRLNYADNILKKSGLNPEEPANARTRINIAGEKLRDDIKAWTDPVTGALNATGFSARIDELTDSAKKNNTHLSVIDGDVLGLKKINDTEGHPAGDKYLRNIAQTLQSRFGIHVYRHGGDEFRITLPNTTGDQAKIIEEEVRKLLREKGINMSIGSGEIDLENIGKSFTEIDKQVYEDKERYYAKHPEIERRK